MKKDEVKIILHIGLDGQNLKEISSKIRDVILSNTSLKLEEIEICANGVGICLYYFLDDPEIGLYSEIKNGNGEGTIKTKIERF